MSEEADRRNRMDAARAMPERLLSNLHGSGIIPASYMKRVPYREGQREVVVYRGVPPGVTEIRPGDWVSLTRSHAAAHDRGGGVISARVPASHVMWAGTDLEEWFYVPVGRAASAQRVAARWLSAGQVYRVPAAAVYAGGWEWDRSGFADWPEFKRKPRSEQVAWAKEYVGSGIREPVDVTVYADGGLGFTDGHHRVMAGTVLGIEIPVRISFRNFDPDWWPDLLELLEAGYTRRQYNPQAWSLKTSGVPPLEVVRKGPDAADEWIVTHERS